jgi:ATP-dependent helicase/nuclease subunit A
VAEKTARFLERFSRWRKRVKQVSLSQCLEGILAETFYTDWLRAQSRGAQRAANVAAFLRLAQRFDQFQRQGLYRFLKFIEAQQEADAEPEVPATPSENAVRLMSIHQSKGLEFPVVVLADLAKNFNEQDLRGEIIFDEHFGLCPKVKPPQTGRRYPSLPHWLAQRRQRRELRGEELRLFYVALTRARDYLILTASVTEKSWTEKWTQPQAATARKIAAAKSFGDWLALWTGTAGITSGTTGLAKSPPDAGAAGELRWQIIPDEDLAGSAVANPGELQTPIAESELSQIGGQEIMAALRARLEWEYPFGAATTRQAKASVTALRREAEELDDEAEPLFYPPPSAPRGPATAKTKTQSPRLSAAEIGAAHHNFLQYVALDKIAALAAEAARLKQENYLTDDEHAALDLPALAQFWASALGHKILAQAGAVRRELPFTARFTPAEIAERIGTPAPGDLADEFIVVQGVADLVVLLPREIWLVDFKTDQVGKRELPGKIRLYTPQLLLYADALEKIFFRPVTFRALHFLAAGRTEQI